MVKLKLIGKKGSKACKEIRSGANIRGYVGKTRLMPDALINYGLAGTRLNIFYRRYPSAERLLTINRRIGYSKYSVCNRAAKNNILVPKSKLSLDRKDNKSGWIEKRTNSIGGLGIRLARGKRMIDGKYYQEFIQNRRYELRIHAFMWIPKEEWRVQKRLGKEDEIAWNYKNGGRFITVHNPQAYDIFIEAKDVSEKVMELLDMSFGAVDFLVDSNNQLYFIEINSAPGFSELSRPIYIDAFQRLKDISRKELRRYAR